LINGFRAVRIIDEAIYSMLDFGKSTGVKAQEETKSKKRQQQLEKKERELKREK